MRIYSILRLPYSRPEIFQTYGPGCIAARRLVRYNGFLMLSEVARVCPRCQSGSGQPFRAVPDEGTDNVRVLMRCDACHHRWSAMVPRDTLSPADQDRLRGESTWPPH